MIRLEDDDGYPMVSTPVALLVYICAGFVLVGVAWLLTVAAITVLGS